MAIIQTNKVSKAKLAYQIDGSDADPINRTKTLGNLASGVSDANLYAGLSALAQMINANASGVALKRVDEYELVDDSEA